MPGTRPVYRLFQVFALASLLVAACAPAATTPTSAPAQQEPAAAAAKTEAKSASESTDGPRAAARPTGEPASKPAEKPAGSDDKAVADFYKDKTVRLVVGYSSGGLVDTYSRLVGRALGKHIPGNPTVIVENRPGAGGLVAGNAVYNTEPKDGTVIGVHLLGIVVQELIQEPAVQFESDKFQWLGAPNQDYNTCLARKDHPVQSIQDLMADKKLIIGSVGKGNTTFQAPAAMNAVLGTNFEIISGYGSLSKARLAFDGGEIDGYCPVFSALPSLDRQRVEGENATARVIVVQGNPPDHPLLKEVPQAVDLANTEQDKALLRTVALQDEFFPSFALPPGTPEDRVMALRAALDKTFKDPEFLAAAEDTKVAINPGAGAEIQQSIEAVLALPKSVRDRLKQIIS